jgi:hypothetical protein
MQNNRLQLIAKAAKLVKAEKKSLHSLERQAIMLSDREYVSTTKQADNAVTELDFN